MKLKKWPPFFLLSFLLLFLPGWCSVALAAVGDFKFEVNAFGSLSCSLSDSDSLGFIRDYQQKKPVEKGEFTCLADSNIGVQFNTRYKNFSAVLQLLARERLESDLRHLVNYAYIDVLLGSDFTVRVGKNPLELYLSSDNRVVSYSLLPLRPVSEFYTMLFDESYPGVDLHYRRQFEDGLLTLDAFTGTFDAALLPESVGTKDFGYDPMAGVAVRYSIGESVFLVSYLWARVTDIHPIIERTLLPAMQFFEKIGVPHSREFVEMVRTDSAPVHYFVIAGSTQMKNWVFRGEANYVLFDFIGNMRISSGYLQAGYEIGNWTPYAVLAGVYTKKDDIELSVDSFAEELPEDIVYAAYLANGLYRRLASRQFSLNLGVRWDFHPGMAMKVQWGYYHVRGGGILLWDALNEDAYNGGDVNVLSASVDFAF